MDNMIAIMRTWGFACVWSLRVGFTNLEFKSVFVHARWIPKTRKIRSAMVLQNSGCDGFCKICFSLETEGGEVIWGW